MVLSGIHSSHILQVAVLERLEPIWPQNRGLWVGRVWPAGAGGRKHLASQLPGGRLRDGHTLLG